MNEAALNRILGRAEREPKAVLRPVPDVPGLAELLGMPLSDFAKASLLVRVRCQALDGEEIYFASTEREAEIGRAEGLQVYTAEELAELYRLQPDEAALKTIHEAKRALGAKIIEAER